MHPTTPPQLRLSAFRAFPVPQFEGKEFRTDQPRAVIAWSDWRRIMACARMTSPVEVNGFGRVEVAGACTFMLSCPFTLPQTVHHSRARTDPKAFASWLVGERRAGRDTSSVRLQWHSHGQSPVFFSQDDQKTIARFAGHCPWLVSVVVNAAGESLCRLDIFTPPRVALELPVLVALPHDNAETAALYTELAANLTVVDPGHTSTRKKGARQNRTEDLAALPRVAFTPGDSGTFLVPANALAALGGAL